MTLHPAFQEYLDELNPAVAKLVAEGFVPTPESARAALAGLNQYALPQTSVARVFDAVIPDAAHDIPVRVYVPRPGEPSDAILFVHGGGHLAGDLDVYDFSAHRVAAATGMVTVSVDYRRSPEAPFPAGLVDAYHALHGLSAVLPDVATTGVMHAVGDSGGAAKLASIAMRVAAGEWSSPVRRQVLLYPSLDYTMRGDSMREFATGYFLSAERVGWYFDHYFAEDTDREAVSPLSGPFTPDMPETLLIAAEYDPLRSEAIDYAARAQAAGAPVHVLIAPGMIHAFAFFETIVPEAIARLYEVIAGFLHTGDVPRDW